MGSTLMLRNGQAGSCLSGGHRWADWSGKSRFGSLCGQDIGGVDTHILMSFEAQAGSALTLRDDFHHLEAVDGQIG